MKLMGSQIDTGENNHISCFLSQRIVNMGAEKVEKVMELIKAIKVGAS
jgi:hypothetical protein